MYEQPNLKRTNIHQPKKSVTFFEVSSSEICIFTWQEIGERRAEYANQPILYLYYPMLLAALCCDEQS